MKRFELQNPFAVANFIDIVGEIPVVLTTGGIALTYKL